MVPQTTPAFEGIEGLNLPLGAHIRDKLPSLDISKPQMLLLCVPMTPCDPLSEGAYYLVIFSFCICHPHEIGNALKMAL